MNQPRDVQQRPHMSRYQMVHRGEKTTLTIVAVVLGIICAILAIVTIWATDSRSTMAKKLATTEIDYDKSQANVKEVMDKVKKYQEANEKLNKRRMGATQTASVAPTVVATEDTDTDNSHDDEYYKRRCKKLEVELAQSQSATTRCMELLSPKQRRAIQSQTPISIVGLDVENEAKYIRVRFTVTNNTDDLAENISGHIRFWNDTKMVVEHPFKIDSIEANESTKMSLKVPTVAYTKYNSYVRMGRN